MGAAREHTKEYRPQLRRVFALLDIQRLAALAGSQIGNRLRLGSHGRGGAGASDASRGGAGEPRSQASERASPAER